MKSTYKISGKRIEKAVNNIFTTILTNKLKRKIPEYIEADPWVLSKMILSTLREINLDDFATPILMNLINGDDFDEKASLLSVEFYKRKFPRLKE